MPATERLTSEVPFARPSASCTTRTRTPASARPSPIAATAMRTKRVRLVPMIHERLSRKLPRSADPSVGTFTLVERGSDRPRLVDRERRRRERRRLKSRIRAGKPTRTTVGNDSSTSVTRHAGLEAEDASPHPRQRWSRYSGSMPYVYLVTGGAGFIGSHLTDALLARGDRVIALDALSTGRLENIESAAAHPNFRFVQGSVLDEMMVDELVHESDLVVHLAAAVGVKLIVERPLHSFTTNIRGSEIVIEAAHRYRRKTLVVSTSEIYGKNDRGPLKETDDRILGTPSVARWAYSTAKAVDEILANVYHRERGLPTFVVRLFNTVGPRQSPAYGMVIPRLVRQAVDGEPLTVFGDGRQTRCFCHVLDVVDAL